MKRRWLMLLLAMVMILGISMTAFASEEDIEPVENNSEITGENLEDSGHNRGSEGTNETSDIAESELDIENGPATEFESVKGENDTSESELDTAGEDDDVASLSAEFLDNDIEPVAPSKLITINGVYYYSISSLEELYYIAEVGGEWLDYNYILDNDIVVNDVDLTTDENGNLLVDPSNLTDWIPIDQFSGLFDGNGYSISGVYLDRNGAAGLFLECTGIIKNLSVKNSYIKGTENVGGISSYFCGSGKYISDCDFEGTIIGDNNVGGIIGGNYSSYIENCTNNGNVFATGDYAAGIVGNYNADEIRNCVNNGNIYSTGDYVAGIAGHSDRDEIFLNENNGHIEGTEYVGGICGSIDGAIIEDCINTGEILGESYVGGLCGQATGEQADIYKCYNLSSVVGSSYVGGLVGYLDYALISKCYNVGDVTGKEYVGAIVGQSQSVWGHGSVLKCYYLSGTNWGFGNVAEDIEGVVEGRDSAFFPVLNSPTADASYDNLGYDISKATITVADATYTGKTLKPTVTVKYGSTKLTNDTDYTVKYSNNTNAGTATITVNGKGDYNGTATKNFTINKASQTITAKAGKKTLYSGSSGKTYTNITASTSGNGKLTYSSSNAKVAKVNSSGKVTAVAKGTATITVKAGATTNYKASTKTIKITVKKLSAPKISSIKNSGSKKAKVKWGKVSNASGYQIRYSTKKSMKNAKTKKITKASTVSKTISGLKKGKTYYVQIRSYKKIGSTVYSSWSSKKKVKIKK